MVYFVSLRPLACWDRGFEPPRGHRCLSRVLCVMQLQVSATTRSVVHRSPTECVRVSFIVIRCNSNPLHLQCVGRRGQTGKEKMFLSSLLFYLFKSRLTSKFVYLGNMIFYEKVLDIDNQLHNYLKITGILNNVFRPQKLLRK